MVQLHAVTQVEIAVGDYQAGLEFLIVLGCFLGFINGLLGVAGSSTFVPAMLFGLPHFFGVAGPDVPKIAMATAVGLLIPTAIASAQAHASRNAIDWRLLALFTPSVFVGAFVMSLFAASLSAKILMATFAVFIVVFAWRMMTAADDDATATQGGAPKLIPLAMKGLLGGALSSLLGLGASFFAVPVLSRHVSLARAIGTATALSVPMAAAGITGYLVADAPAICQHKCAGYIFLPAVATAGVSAMLMAPLGAAVAHHLPTRLLRKVWALWLLLMAAHMFSNVVSPAALAAETRRLIALAETSVWPPYTRPLPAEVPVWLRAARATPPFALALEPGSGR